MEYIIGIGANIGYTLENIKTAIEVISQHKDMQVLAKASLYSSKALLKADAPASWDITYINTAIKIKSALKPKDLLKVLKFIEINIGRDFEKPRWSPRIIDLDILAAGNMLYHDQELNIPHKELLNRSFALAPLLEIDNNWRHPAFYNDDLNAKLATLDKSIKLKQKLSSTMRMGIVNLSDQSFSDGNLDTKQRQENLFELIEAGAEIIDIGAESTKPNAITMPIDEEFSKLDDFLNYLKSQFPNLKYRPLISIDTRRFEIMQKILAKHNDIIWMINDVECNDITKKAKLIAKYDKKYVITHNTGITDRDKYLKIDNSINEIIEYFNNKKNTLLEYGVKQSNIYFDIGFGFGKKAETAKFLLENINKIKNNLKLKALVGHSRKPSILGIAKNSSIEELDIATKNLSLELEKLNIEIIRVHKI